MDDIRQRDLSDKRVQDMTLAERREMKRRLAEFVRLMRKDGRPSAPGAHPRGEKAPRKWSPQAKAGAGRP